MTLFPMTDNLCTEKVKQENDSLIADKAESLFFHVFERFFKFLKELKTIMLIYESGNNKEFISLASV